MIAWYWLVVAFLGGIAWLLIFQLCIKAAENPGRDDESGAMY